MYLDKLLWFFKHNCKLQAEKEASWCEELPVITGVMLTSHIPVRVKVIILKKCLKILLIFDIDLFCKFT